MAGAQFDEESDDESKQLIEDKSQISDRKFVRLSSPVDRFYSVYCIFFLLGVGSLLPWNFFTNAKQYFLYKLRNTTINGSISWTNASFFTEDQIMFENYLELAAQIPSILFVFINMTLTKVVSNRIRIVSSICLMLVLFTLTICLTKVNTDGWQSAFLIISLAMIVLMNAGSAVLQGAICGLASMFPQNYMQGTFSGMGFGGLVASLASLATLSIGSSPVDSGFAFFLVAEFVLLCCLFGYLLISCSAFVQFYTSGADLASINTSMSIDISDNEVGLISPAVLHTENDKNTFSSILAVARKIWIPGLSILFVFLVTLACYPAIMSSIQSFSADEVWAKIYFTPVVCFVLFNLTDFIGRNLAGVIRRPKDGSPVFLIVCLLRTLFIPLFLMCNLQPRSSDKYVFFKSDAAPIILSCLFGVSNGYMATVSMMHSPRLVPDGDVELAGSMMAFFMALGLGLGAALSMLIVKEL